MVTWRAIGDVPRQLVASLAAERRVRGTRALSWGKQAVFALVWFRGRRPLPLIGTGRGICQPTSSRSLTETTCVLAAQAPDLHQALWWVADDGWPHVVGDGTIIDSDRSREKTTSRTGMTIDAG